MTTASRTASLRGRAERNPHRSTDLITAPLDELARHSASLIAREPVRFDLAEQTHALPRYLFLGPQGGAEPMRVGLFAGIHGDEPAASFALLRFVRWLEEDPEIARGYCLFLYPVLNPTGFTDNTRHNRNGKDLNREFWRDSCEPEVRLLESELRTQNFDGLISLHTDDTSDGLYGYAHGALLTEHLIRPALAAAAQFLPRNRGQVIDGFHARDSVICDRPEGVLRAQPGRKPRPFEVVLETPDHAPQYLQEAALAVALCSILGEYRKFVAHARNL